MAELDSNQVVDYPQPQGNDYVAPAFNASMFPQQPETSKTGAGVINAYAQANQAIQSQPALNPNDAYGTNEFNMNSFVPNVSQASVDAVKKALNKEVVPEGLTREDYYPALGLPTQQGSGSDIIGSYNTYASHDIIPVGLINAYKLAKQKQAIDNKKMAEYKQELYDVKDSIINNNWIPTQIRTTQDLLQKFKDKYGNETGAILAKDSPELKMLTQQFRTRTKAFNDYYEEAANTILQYEAGDRSTTTDKEGGKNDSEVVKTQGGLYVSKFMYDKAKNWMSHMTNPNLTVQDIMNYNPNDFATGKNMESVVVPVATRLSKNLSQSLINESLAKNTNITDLYRKVTEQGLNPFDKNQLEEINRNADIVWERDYSRLPPNARPTKQEVREMMQQYVTHEYKLDLQQVSKDNYYQRKAIDKKFEAQSPILISNEPKSIGNKTMMIKYAQTSNKPIPFSTTQGMKAVDENGNIVDIKPDSEVRVLSGGILKTGKNHKNDAPYIEFEQTVDNGDGTTTTHTYHGSPRYFGTGKDNVFSANKVDLKPEVEKIFSAKTPSEQGYDAVQESRDIQGAINAGITVKQPDNANSNTFRQQQNINTATKPVTGNSR